MDGTTFYAMWLSALWLGILTSISPCPLATNIAAISFIGKNVVSPQKVLFAGLLYTIGRMLAYLLIAVIIVAGLLSSFQIGRFLQDYLSIILGPLLILIGILLLGLFTINIGKGSKLTQKIVTKFEKRGLIGAGVIGFIFALSFCPVSAGIFFGGLVPLALKNHSAIGLPLVYGIGTALPVIVFAVVISFAVQSVGKIFNLITKFEYYAQKVTGIIFIIAGVYISLRFIFGVEI